MLYVVSCLLMLLTLFSYRIKEKRRFVLIATILFSIFFFSSSSPVTGLPLYFIWMLFSIVLSLIFKPGIKFKELHIYTVILLLLLVSLSVPIFTILFGNVSYKVLLIKSSNTDTINIASQLSYPSFNFTIIKHFVFLLLYLSFLILNADLINQKNFRLIFHKITEKAFVVLFICIIVEFLIVNLFGGINDRNIMKFIFSIGNMNQLENWYTFGSYSVAFCFTERSSIGCVLIFYLILSQSKKYGIKFFSEVVLSAISIYCTGSSTGLGICCVFVLYFFLKILIQKNAIEIKIAALVFVVFAFLMIAINYDTFFSKITVYLNNSEVYGSGYFRRQANDLGLEAFFEKPLFGFGIGTVYCHCLLIQTLANLGLVGTVLVLILHYRIIKNGDFNFDYIVKAIICLLIFNFTFMIQQFTSPWLLAVFLSLNNLAFLALPKVRYQKALRCC